MYQWGRALGRSERPLGTATGHPHTQTLLHLLQLAPGPKGGVPAGQQGFLQRHWLSAALLGFLLVARWRLAAAVEGAALGR